jgi:hypothetical protein
VTAKGDWTLEKVMTKKDSVKWLTISQESGTARRVGGEAHCPQNPRWSHGRAVCSRAMARHSTSTSSRAWPRCVGTCAEVIAGPDSKTYQVTGTVTAIANTTYGNWYLTDKTGTIYIYGTLDAKGAEKISPASA